MGDNKDFIQSKNINDSNAITISKSDGTKEYFTHCTKLLSDFKMMQGVIFEAQGPDVPILIRVAQKNLTTSAISIAEDMIKECQIAFNSKNVQTFIEKTISLITSIETANYLFGNMIDVEDIRKYISGKATNVTRVRSEKLLNQLKITNFEDKPKLNIIVENLNLCIKVLEYSWDIYPKNIKSLQQGNIIVNTMRAQKVKLGLDNYNLELLSMMVEKNNVKIKNIKMRNSRVFTINENILKSYENVVSNDNIISSDNVLSEIDFESCNTTTTALVQTNNSATDKFMEMTDNVIKEVTESSSNDFLNIALQKFYSIIGSIETLNYLKGDVVNKKAVTDNISSLLTEMIYSNYTAITRSWNEIEDKSLEDYNAYAKEVANYSEILLEAYNMSNSNLDALKKCVEIENNLYIKKDEFRFTPGQQAKLNYAINSHMVLINKVEPSYKIIRQSPAKNDSKKKRGFWSKIFN